MEASKSSAGFLLLLGVVIGLVSSSEAYDFYVGGKDGWVSNPSEDYGRWAGRNRFQVNDTLVFKYKKGNNSVLVVTKEAYDSCNLSNPIKRFDDGDSVFKFDRSGPFYFISGTGNLCQKGQKLIIMVMAVRNKPPTQSPPSPGPSLSPSPTPSPKPPPGPSLSPSPTPSPNPPTSSPAPSPSTHVPPPSPSPASSSSPAPSPSTHVSPPSPSPASSSSPSGAPSPSTHVPPPSPSPASSSSPSGAPSPSSPGSGPGVAPAPSPSGNPSNSSSSSSVLSGLSFGLVALVLGTAFIY